MNMREPAGIVLFVNQDVVRLRRSQPVTPDLHRTMIFVELDVEEALRIRAPYHRAVGFLDQVVAVLSTLPIAQPDREIFRTLDVGAPGFQPMVGRMPGAAEPEVVVAGRGLIASAHD